MSAAFEQAKAHFLAGLAAQKAGQPQQAVTHYQLSLVLLPGRASTLTNLGAVLVQLGRAAEALPLLEQAQAAEPGQSESLLQQGLALAQLRQDEGAVDCLTRCAFDAGTPSAVWLELAACQARLGRLDAALTCSEQATSRHSDDPQAWALQGGLLKDLGRPQQAAHALRRAIALGADPDVNGFLLASIEGGDAPAQPPAGYVQGLFDAYAPSFEQHLLKHLNYSAHERVAGLLRRGLLVGPRSASAAALDLGCGTGLCGPLMRPLTPHLEGVDLSSAMLDQARARGVYDSLVQADIASHLHDTPQRFGLVAAADVFIYVGALDAVFSGVGRVLMPGGLFAFSVELADDARDFELRSSSRYAQSQRYLLALAAQQGLRVLISKQEPVRLDQQQPVQGLYLLLQAPD